MAAKSNGDGKFDVEFGQDLIDRGIALLGPTIHEILIHQRFRSSVAGNNSITLDHRLRAGSGHLNRPLQLVPPEPFSPQEEIRRDTSREWDPVAFGNRKKHFIGIRVTIIDRHNGTTSTIIGIE